MQPFWNREMNWSSDVRKKLKRRCGSMGEVGPRRMVESRREVYICFFCFPRHIAEGREGEEEGQVRIEFGTRMLHGHDGNK